MNLPGEGISIGEHVEVDILEGLRDRATILWVVTHHGDLSSIDVLVEPVVQVDFYRDIGREVELRVCTAKVSFSFRNTSTENDKTYTKCKCGVLTGRLLQWRTCRPRRRRSLAG